MSHREDFERVVRGNESGGILNPAIISIGG